MALTKDRAIVPVELAVAHLSGTGGDAVFAGVMRCAVPTDTRTVRVSPARRAAPAGLPSRVALVCLALPGARRVPS